MGQSIDRQFAEKEWYFKLRTPKAKLALHQVFEGLKVGHVQPAFPFLTIVYHVFYAFKLFLQKFIFIMCVYVNLWFKFIIYFLC
jgi:hypothetical protein